MTRRVFVPMDIHTVVRSSQPRPRRARGWESALFWTITVAACAALWTAAIVAVVLR